MTQHEEDISNEGRTQTLYTGGQTVRFGEQQCIT